MAAKKKTAKKSAKRTAAIAPKVEDAVVSTETTEAPAPAPSGDAVQRPGLTPAA